MFNKYRAKKTIIDGITFASKAEARRYFELKILLKAGDIKDLQLQPKFVLQPKYINLETGKTEREIAYIADFQYADKSGKVIVEDTKGFKTKDYLLKRKMFIYRYQQYYEFREIR
jgi:Protein of unknown function (DUF1064).